MRKLELVGMKFGKLLVVSQAGMAKGHSIFDCICECGNRRICRGYELKNGAVSCCGCSNGDVNRRIKYLNRQLYEIWKGMRARCRYKNHASRKNYLDRGVKVCKEWNESFRPFYDWCMSNGWKPGLQIDKDIIPQKLGIEPLLYSPEMCCIVTHKINGQNSRQAKLNLKKAEQIRKSSLGITKLSQKYKVSKSTIYRIKSNKAWA